LVVLPKLEQLNTDHGRFYRTPDGIVYPSVTTVLSSQKDDFLDEWRKAVGEEEAAKISQRASSRGTRIHKYIEEHLLGNSVKCSSIIDQVAYNSLIPVLSEISDVRAIETRLYSNYLKSAGTVDLCARFKKRRSIIDWKTSNGLKYKSQLDSYFMQAAAYAVAWEERTKEPIINLVIIMAVDMDVPQLFIEHRDNWVGQYMKIRKEFKNEYMGAI